MIIYRTSDRIPVQIGEVRFLISPLSFSQRSAIAQLSQLKAGTEHMDLSKIGKMTVRYAVKGVTGLKTSTGDDYVPDFEADGSLSDDSVEDILGLDLMPKLMTVCGKLMESISDHAIEGVKIDIQGVHSAKKAVPSG